MSVLFRVIHRRCRIHIRAMAAAGGDIIRNVMIVVRVVGHHLSVSIHCHEIFYRMNHRRTAVRKQTQRARRDRKTILYKVTKVEQRQRENAVAENEKVATVGYLLTCPHTCWRRIEVVWGVTFSTPKRLFTSFACKAYRTVIVDKPAHPAALPLSACG